MCESCVLLGRQASHENWSCLLRQEHRSLPTQDHTNTERPEVCLPTPPDSHGLHLRGSNTPRPKTTGRGRNWGLWHTPTRVRKRWVQRLPTRNCSGAEPEFIRREGCGNTRSTTAQTQRAVWEKTTELEQIVTTVWHTPRAVLKRDTTWRTDTLVTLPDQTLNRARNQRQS